jgi:hypothetical protein
VDKWLQYAEGYDAHFPKPNELTSPITLLEIGVQSGGSLRDWKEYYGDKVKIVGLDIDERCRRSHSPSESIFIEIGSQIDTDFLSKVCDLHGPFDIIVDDGGHTANMIKVTLNYMFPNDRCMKKKSVYAIEDTHVILHGQKYMKSPEELSVDVIADAFVALHKFDHPIYSNKLTAMHVYDSLVFFMRGERLPLKRVTRGPDAFANMETTLNPQGSYGDKGKKGMHRNRPGQGGHGGGGGGW